MVFRNNVFDKWGKAIPKGKKTKTQVTTESNGGSQKEGCQCAFTINTLYLFPTITNTCYYEKRHINAIKGICHGNILQGDKATFATHVPWTLKDFIPNNLWLCLDGKTS